MIGRSKKELKLVVRSKERDIVMKKAHTLLFWNVFSLFLVGLTKFCKKWVIWHTPSKRSALLIDSILGDALGIMRYGLEGTYAKS